MSKRQLLLKSNNTRTQKSVASDEEKPIKRLKATKQPKLKTAKKAKKTKKAFTRVLKNSDKYSVHEYEKRALKKPRKRGSILQKNCTALPKAEDQSAKEKFVCTKTASCTGMEADVFNFPSDDEVAATDFSTTTDQTLLSELSPKQPLLKAKTSYVERMDKDEFDSEPSDSGDESAFPVYDMLMKTTTPSKKQVLK